MKCNHDLNSDKNCLLRVPIFNHLEEKYLKEILVLLKSKDFKRGEEIFNPYSNSSDLYIIRKGYVKVYKLTENGKEQILRFLGPGDFLGELNIFTNNNHDTYASSLDEVEICMISRSQFEEVISKYPNISLEILKEMSKRLDSVENKLTLVSASNVVARVSNYLLSLLNPLSKSKVIYLPMKKKDLASYLSISAESLSRTFKRLESDELIKQIDNRKIELLKTDLLHELTTI